MILKINKSLLLEHRYRLWIRSETFFLWQSGPSLHKTNNEPHVYFGTEAFDHDGIEKRGQIVKIEDHTIHFHDGTSTFADAIILGTGFLYHYPFYQNPQNSKN